MSMTIAYEHPLHVLELEDSKFKRWCKKHPKKFRKLQRALSRKVRVDEGRLPRDLSGTEKVQVIYTKMDREFKDNPIGETPDGNMEYKGLVRDIKVKSKSKVLGIRPIFEVVTYEPNIIEATNDRKVTRFTGSLTPVREYPQGGKNANPHQSRRECSRRSNL